jgi:uncharacterized membrane protein YtjA (UPF0391 family)
MMPSIFDDAAGGRACGFAGIIPAGSHASRSSAPGDCPSAAAARTVRGSTKGAAHSSGNCPAGTIGRYRTLDECKNTVRQRLLPAAEEGVRAMLNWVVTFLIIALVAAVLGFGGIAGAAVEIAKVIFFIAILLFLVAVVVGMIGRGGRGFPR